MTVSWIYNSCAFNSLKSEYILVWNKSSGGWNKSIQLLQNGNKITSPHFPWDLWSRRSGWGLRQTSTWLLILWTMITWTRKYLPSVNIISVNGKKTLKRLLWTTFTKKKKKPLWANINSIFLIFLFLPYKDFFKSEEIAVKNYFIALNENICLLSSNDLQYSICKASLGPLLFHLTLAEPFFIAS